MNDGQERRDRERRRHVVKCFRLDSNPGQLRTTKYHLYLILSCAFVTCSVDIKSVSPLVLLLVGNSSSPVSVHEPYGLAYTVYIHITLHCVYIIDIN